MEKYASNVIEKCIEVKEENIIGIYIKEICSNNEVLGIYQCIILDLMKNNYGNYVVQKALRIAKNENKKILVEYVSRNVDRLGEKKIIEKWRNILLQSESNEPNVENTSPTKNILKNNPKYGMNIDNQNTGERRGSLGRGKKLTGKKGINPPSSLFKTLVIHEEGEQGSNQLNNQFKKQKSEKLLHNKIISSDKSNIKFIT